MGIDFSAAAEDASRGRVGPKESRLQGHWLLASLGKRVLRPGGMEMTSRLLEQAGPSDADDVVEFGPGVGRTASLLLAASPRSYVGVDPNPEGAGAVRKVLQGHNQARLVTAGADSTGLDSGCASLVIGEAMLTMQSESEKLQIMQEPFRLLRPGGRYCIHELAFAASTPKETQGEVSREISRSIKVGARPLTLDGWEKLLEQAGFKVEHASFGAMHLLEPKRILADEGLWRTLRFAFNVLRNRPAQKRLRTMRAVFRRHDKYLRAIGLVAIKP